MAEREQIFDEERPTLTLIICFNTGLSLTGKHIASYDSVDM